MLNYREPLVIGRRLFLAGICLASTTLFNGCGGGARSTQGPLSKVWAGSAINVVRGGPNRFLQLNLSQVGTTLSGTATVTQSGDETTSPLSGRYDRQVNPKDPILITISSTPGNTVCEGDWTSSDPQSMTLRFRQFDSDGVTVAWESIATLFPPVPAPPDNSGGGE